MRILVVGGTRFIGRHTVARLLTAGHDVTLLHRGLTGIDLFPDARRLLLDRQGPDLGGLGDHGDWDAVIDLSGYFPRDVARLVSVLEGRIGRYVFCSTISAYAAADPLLMADPHRRLPMLHEDLPLAGCSDDEALDPSQATYGRRKAACERVVTAAQAKGLATVILRPSVVYGAYDPTDRMAHWFWRAARPAPFLLPEDGLTITQRTYAPDLASALLEVCQRPALAGLICNVAEADPLSLRDTLALLGDQGAGDPLARAIPVPASDAECLDGAGGLPLWIPRKHLLIDTCRFRSQLASPSTPVAIALAQAAADFIAEDRSPRSGIAPDAEAAWISQHHPLKNLCQ